MDDGARETRTAADQLAIEQERASLALSAARMGEFELDLVRDELILSPRMSEILGRRPDAEEVRPGEVLYSRVHPDDLERMRAAMAEGLAQTQPWEFQFRRARFDNDAPQWISAHLLTLHDTQGRAVRMIGVIQDVTERMRDEDERNTLVAELDHRVKNVLASVQSLAAQSARKTTSVDAFLKTFAGRLEAMASAHTLLTAARWKGADIGDIAAAELGGLAPGQAHWSGPEILLSPRATNALTLALHELATNAVKFGALSTDAGGVEVGWRARDGGGFELSWVEHGGPPVSAPSRRGFGTTLLERVTGRELGGQAKAEFRPDGVRASITADASALAARRNPPPPTAAPEPPPETQAGASFGAGSPGGVKGRRILIVEDAVLLALELEAGLTEAGARVVGTAADVEEALKLSETPFDVAVLDANLNGTPVTPVAEALRALGKPFIFATGYGDAAPVPEGFDAPVVRKPYNISQIAAAIAEAMAR